MKFKQYLALIADPAGFIPVSIFRWIIRKNPRSTAHEEAVAAEVIEQANPRENITGHFPWGPEEQRVLQQLWLHPDDDQKFTIQQSMAWRDIPTKDAESLYSTVPTKHGDMPVPDAVKEPGVVRCDFRQRIDEALGTEEPGE